MCATIINIQGVGFSFAPHLFFGVVFLPLWFILISFLLETVFCSAVFISLDRTSETFFFHFFRYYQRVLGDFKLKNITFMGIHKHKNGVDALFVHV